MPVSGQPIQCANRHLAQASLVGVPKERTHVVNGYDGRHATEKGHRVKWTMKEFDAVSSEQPRQQNLTVETVSRPGHSAELRQTVQFGHDLPIHFLPVANKLEFPFALNNERP